MSQMIAHPWVDESQAPLYIAELVDSSEAETEAFYLACERMYSKLDHSIAWVVDTTHVSRVSARQRQLTATHLRRIRTQAERHVAGTALVVTSPLVRGVLTAIGWLITLPFPHQIAATRTEAIEWATSQLGHWREA